MACVKKVVLSDDSVNSYGFRLLTSGCDLSEFMKNPVMLNAHDYTQPPIGKWDDVHIENDQLIGTTNFDESDPVAAMISRKMENGYINMASVGALPLEFSDDPTLKIGNQEGPTITRWILKEASPVAIGSNKNAFVQLYDKAGNKIEMTQANIISLFEGKKPTFKTENQMKELAKLLNLAETAVETEFVTVVKEIQEKAGRLEVELAEATKKLTNAETKLAEIAKEKEIALKAEAKALVEAAVKDARIAADAMESYLKLFDLDFDSAKKALELIPKRESIAGKINNKGVTELADLSTKSWDELDKSGKLALVKEKYPELYQMKFDEKFPKG